MPDSSIPPQSAPFDFGEFDALAHDPIEQKRLIGKWLDDARAAPVFWRMVETRGGLEVGDWKFVAEPSEVVRILRDDAQFLVREYDRRMRAASGRFYLGMDGADHERDAALGDIIPSWNAPEQSSDAYPAPRRAPDHAALAQVVAAAAAASRAVLAGLGRRTRLARLTRPEAPCQCAIAEVLGPVLDACAAVGFGVSGPSAYSLLSWGNDIAQYNFRVNADAANRSRARHASALYRAHVLDQIARLNQPAPDPQQPALDEIERTPREGPYGAAQRDALRRCVERLRAHLARDEYAAAQASGRDDAERRREAPARIGRAPAAVSDDDVARNLVGIVTGSLGATAKAFTEGLAAYSREQAEPAGPIAWPGPEARLDFPLYELVIARPLARLRRGSLDAVYRTYAGPDQRSREIWLRDGDTVVVWLGGTLQESLERLQPDRLFGIGVHRCPGMDMGKAIMHGILQTLSRLHGSDSPRLTRIEGDPALAFARPAALEALANA